MKTTQELIQSLENKISSGYWPGYHHSYPHRRTFTQLPQTGINKAIWSPDLEEINLYIHIPFCEMICNFCVLFKTGTKTTYQDLYDQYIEAIEREMRIISPLVRNAKVRSLYIGGGTPNVLSIEQITKLLSHVRNNFPNIARDIVPSIECQPNNVTKEYINGLYDLGFRRLSVGIQSFNEKVSQALGRHLAYRWIEPTLSNLVSSEIDINMDIMYGLPYQTKEIFFNDLNKALLYKPDNLSIYPLYIRETPIRNLVDNMASRSEKYAWWDEADQLLQSHGYSRESYIRYIKNGAITYEQQLLEFRGVPTIGFGAGARSYSPTTHYSFPYRINIAETKEIIADYIQADFEKVHYHGRFLTQRDKKRRSLMLGLLSGGVFTEEYNNYFNNPLEEDFGNEIAALIETGLVTRLPEESKITLTRRGRMYSDICVEIFKDPNEEILESKFLMAK